MHRLRDAIPLPHPGEPVVGRAVREDAYPVVVCRTFEQALATLVERLDGAETAVITDETVEALYGPTLIRGLREAGKDPLVRVLPAGEGSKSLDEAVAAWHWLAESDLARRDVLVAFGGGVIADLGGWVASGYMRGIPYVNVPTTLLAQVDGALGGKVAVNHPVAKNLLGAFHSPLGVIANVGFLPHDQRAAPARRPRGGDQEGGHRVARLLALHRDPRRRAARRAIRTRSSGSSTRPPPIKTALIERDPYERDLRRPLNFGHTIGHPLETVTGYGPLLHGEAVAFGMVVESRIAARPRAARRHARSSGCSLSCGRARCRRRADELPAEVDADAIVDAMEKVRQIRAGSLRFVLPVALGETVIADDVSDAEVREALAACGVGGRDERIGLGPAVVARLRHR